MGWTESEILIINKRWCRYRIEKKSLFKCKTVDNKLGVLNLTVAVSSPVPRVVQLQVPFTDKPTLWFATFWQSTLSHQGALLETLSWSMAHTCLRRTQLQDGWQLFVLKIQGIIYWAFVIYFKWTPTTSIHSLNFQTTLSTQLFLSNTLSTLYSTFLLTFFSLISLKIYNIDSSMAIFDSHSTKHFILSLFLVFELQIEFEVWYIEFKSDFCFWSTFIYQMH